MMACARQARRGQAPSWDRLNKALVLFRLACKLRPGALESSAHPDTNLGMKKDAKAQETLLYEQKGCGDYTVLFQLRESC